jgi:transcriptional regulator with GAF, ATPase, and Fis domain
MLWVGFAVIVAIAFFAGWRYARTTHSEPDAQETVANLQALNALLRTLTSSPDITRSLSELARRIRALVPCDRVGLALLTDDRQAYTTYTARPDVESSSAEPDPDLHFGRGDTLIDEVVLARAPRLVTDLDEQAPQHLDANVLKSEHFESLALIPLVFEGEAIGTLNLASRRRAAFTSADLDTLRPVAEALAAAVGTRRLAATLARQKMGQELADLTFAFANDMNSAVQAMIGGCELLTRESHDPMVRSGTESVLQQARRIGDILSQMQRMVRQRAGTPPQSM